jgi:alpha-L-arabinofuranosidase
MLQVPVTVGAPMHIWNPMLGGAVWLESRYAAKKHAEALSWYPGEVLMTVKTPSNGFGYRFDLNTFEPNTEEYTYFNFDGTDEGQPTTIDDIFQIFGKPNAKFIFHVPVPNTNLKLGTERYSWQTPEFYAAELQYLFGRADSPEIYNQLGISVDFTSASVSFNWANLRARRGQVAPYRVEAIILGMEPYHIEGWSAEDGASFGKAVELYRKAMRARGIALPYGVHVSQLPPTNRNWFKPMMQELAPSDPPEYFDLYHHYTFTAGDDWLRAFPITINSDGFTDFWNDKKTWRADYTHFLWLIEDTKKALTDLGISANNAKIGFSEHGITITSRFRFNDMMGAIHWANWLSEIMRYDTDWDAMWVLFAEGYATAQVQLRDRVLTKTPAFFVYEMAMKLRGLRYIESTAASPMGEATMPEGQKVNFPWVVVRVFDNPKTGNRELFVINQHPDKVALLIGFEQWKIISWDKLSGPTYASGNALSSSATPIHTEKVSVSPTTKLEIPPISINHIILDP